MIRAAPLGALLSVPVATMMISGAALLLAGGAFVAGDCLQLRRLFQTDLSTTAAIVAEDTAKALSQHDHEAADRAIRSLYNDTRIVAVAVYVPGENKPFAEHQFSGNRNASADGIRKPGLYEEAGSMQLVRNVVLNREKVGVLAIRADTSDLTFLFFRDLLLALSTLIVGLAVTFLFASALQGAGARATETLADRTEPQEPELATQAQQEDQVAEWIAAAERSNAELTAAKDSAAEAARVKDALLANLSHHIRTPMNGVIAMAQLALETELTPEQAKYIESAGRSAESVLNIVSDIIDFSRIEDGGVTLEREEFDISETLYEVMRNFAPSARKKGIALLLDIHNDVPSAVVGDPARFGRIMANLVENAVANTDNGTVTVEASSVFYSDRVVGLHLRVSDTGRGFDMSQFQRALAPFEHTRDSTSWLIGGAGHGLAISNRLIGMMGGCLWLDSDTSSGTTLHFTATFEMLGKSMSAPPDLTVLRGATVLVADGSPGTRRMIERLLSLWQMKPVPATSGPEATELMRQAMANGTPFDLALVDRHMLGLDGSEFAKDVAEHPELGNPVIMVLSSVNTVSVTDLNREFHPAGYLVKPIGHSALLKAVLGAMRALRAQRGTHLSINTPPLPGSARILIAEDNATSQTVAASVLMKEGYEVSVAASGTEALAAFDRGGLDMILMDIQMPDISGLEATRLIRLREGQSGNHIAILALTAHAMLGDRERCLEAGMDDYVSKPLQVGALRTTVAHWLKLRKHAPGFA